MTSQPHVRASALGLNFGAYRALDSLSFDVEDGEFFVLLGPSGCGKSTLLRAISGLESLDDGVLEIAGIDVTDTHPRDRNIAMIFQNYALYPHMTVRKNIAYPMHVARMSKKDQAAKVAEVADLLELTPYLDRKPSELSGGQRQRVAMGRALVREPALFLMDEPLSNLDAKLRQQMRVELKRLQRQLGITTLYVTHDQVEAMTMADRIMILNAGRIEQVGTPKDVYARPASLFVAAFIGSPPMNFIKEARLAAKVCAHHGIDYPVEDIILAVRPEAFSREAGDLQLTAHCVAAEGLGAETLCHLELQLAAGGVASTDHTQLSEGNGVVTAKWAGDHTDLSDETLDVSVPASSVLSYSARTGALLNPN
ncbi:MAG: ABC transporter ATP-binding protein [Yoonia sp.]|uniref:ABC transporter ATP-binding protein n=1 Tax=Yoonia sp. TaxID=2212373 RepID=UPI003EF0B395